MKLILVIESVGLALGALGALAGIVFAVGARLPVAHEASRSAEFRAPAARVWALISDPGTGGGDEGLKYETVESIPGRRLVRRIVGENLPFGGTWTFELSDSAGASRLTITERGEVYSPIYRFVSRFVMGHAATLDRYLRSLKAGLGEA